jgi:dephospho-CoA kinase
MGACVIDSDAMVRAAYKDERVKQQIKKWWGGMLFDPNGDVDRSAVWRKVQDRPDALRQLEGLLHPMVNEARERLMKAKADDADVVAFVWDTPLLFETGLNEHCDAVVFVEAAPDVRQRRVRETRGWGPEDLAGRENLQMPLDNKRQISDYVVVNTADESYARGQVREVLSRILAATSPVHPAQ